MPRHRKIVSDECRLIQKMPPRQQHAVRIWNLYARNAMCAYLAWVS